MSFISWLLRTALMLSFVLGTTAQAGGVVEAPPAVTHAAAAQAHCPEDEAANLEAHKVHSAHQGTPQHHASAAQPAAGDAQHDMGSDCCKVSTCHCAGSHCASVVDSPVASKHGVSRHAAAPFSRSVYGSPALALSIRPPIA